MGVKESGTMKKSIEVGCAIIEEGGKILISRRRLGDSLGGFWEFPGGKRQAGETIEECLVRELREELAVEIRPRKFLKSVVHDTAGKRLHLFFYICDFIGGTPVFHECMDAQWVAVEELANYQFPPADADILNDLMTRRDSCF